MVVEGPITGEMFLAYVEQCLVPTLKRGDIVVIDRLQAHFAAGVREAIEAAGATLLYLPNTRPTSTQSNWPLPSSKLSCARPPNDPFAVSGAASAPSSRN